MKVLVVGSGGREHVLVWKIKQSELVEEVFCAPGNGGIASMAACVAIAADDIEALLKFAKDKGIGLTVVGPEVPLVGGVVDAFEAEGLKIFGPRKNAAQLEGSKSFAKELMQRAGVPTAHSQTCRSLDEAKAAIAKMGLPIVIKADGLAAGKGVSVCETTGAALAAATAMLDEKIFGEAGQVVVVEECLAGPEASILVLTDGEQVLPLASSRDHKRAFDQDKGPNTGGMGAVSPAPVVTDELFETIRLKIINPVIAAMKREGMVYKGVLYVGIMMTQDGPKVLEFNVRFGDPETQAVLARLESDLVAAMLWTIDGGPPPQLEWDVRPSVCVVAASEGYPGKYEKGRLISGLDQAASGEDVVVFHAGTKQTEAGVLLTSGGRVLGVTGLASSIEEAKDRTYEAIEKIHFEGMYYRRDIGAG